MELTSESIKKATSQCGSHYIAYEMTYTQEVFSSLNGTIRKADGTRAGFVSYDSVKGSFLVTINKAGETSKKDLSAILTTVSKDINELR